MVNEVYADSMERNIKSCSSQSNLCLEYICDQSPSVNTSCKPCLWISWFCPPIPWTNQSNIQLGINCKLLRSHLTQVFYSSTALSNPILLLNGRWVDSQSKTINNILALTKFMDFMDYLNVSFPAQKIFSSYKLYKRSLF